MYHEETNDLVSGSVADIGENSRRSDPMKPYLILFPRVLHLVGHHVCVHPDLF